MKQELHNVETFDFLAGYIDKEGTLHTDFSIREINGSDEEATSKAEIKSNGGKVIRTLLERCCTRIGTIYREDVKPNEWREIIQSLYIGDQDIMLLRLRQISLGDTIETEYKCPVENCKADIHMEVDIDELETIPFNGTRDIEFELPKGGVLKDGTLVKNGKLRLPNGLDREVLDSVMRKNIGQANTMLLTRIITELEGTKVHDDFVRNLSIRDRNYLLEVLRDNNFGINLSVDIDCPSCYETFKASLNAVNFL